MRIAARRDVDAAPLLAVLVAEGEKPALEGQLARIVAPAVQRGDFSGKFRENMLLYGQGKVERVLLVGLGNPKKIDGETIRRASALCEKKAQGLKLKRFALRVPRLRRTPSATLGQWLAEGAVLGSYRYAARRRERADEASSPPEELTLVADSELDELQTGMRRGMTLAAATNFARDLCNAPANIATPRYLAAQARKLAGGAVKCRIYGKPELEKMKMGGILGVAKGSDEPPCLIMLDYHPKGAKDTICLVGKGLTFDSGGISIKPAKGMEEMKFDMSGGAAVLGTFKALRELKPRTRVVGLVPSTENMPGGSAIKPGDVITIYGGLTVEVINTDAEGRLILADGLEFAKTFSPAVTIDLATLTGAVVVALGHDVSGLFCNDETVRRALEDAGAASGERVWPLPLVEEYADGMKSDVADLANIGGKGAGSIMAAYFLSRFASGMKWAHLDIAGTAWDQRSRDYYEKGASGVGVRLLTEFIENWAKSPRAK